MAGVEPLRPFVGTWSVEAVFPGGHPIEGEVTARTEFEFILGGAFLVQRSGVDHPDAPDGLCVIAPKDEGGGYMQHYFDSRGVVRIYEMTFDGTLWTLTRDKPDFSPLDFRQRYTARFEGDGNAVRGTWEICHEGEDWQKDFDLNYTRIK